MAETRRIIFPELEEIIGFKFNVLDNGFLMVVDYMGSDSSIVQTARLSYGAGTKKISEDEGLIRYLMRHKHTSPFEATEIRFHVRVPMDAWRQWIRHRTASVNEYSTRYSIAIKEAQKTPTNKWRKQSKSNKQGSEDFFSEEEGREFSRQEEEIHKQALEIYNDRISRGMAREQARKDLPLATYTEASWKIDLHNLLNFLELRMAPNAQWEIRQYANIIGNEIVAKWVPMTWRAFLDYRINSITLSAPEIDALRKTGIFANLNQDNIQSELSKREMGEFLEKLRRLKE